MSNPTDAEQRGGQCWFCHEPCERVVRVYMNGLPGRPVMALPMCDWCRQSASYDSPDGDAVRKENECS